MLKMSSSQTLTQSFTQDTIQGRISKLKLSADEESEYLQTLRVLIQSVSKEEFLLSPQPNTIRAGVIPYCELDGQIYWLMGITPERKLADFGGGCKNGKNELPFECLIREVQEESSGVLTQTIKDAIRNPINELLIWRARSWRNPPVYRYLLMTPIPYNDYTSEFKPNREVDSLVWIPQNDALKMDIEYFHDPIRQYIRLVQHES